MQQGERLYCLSPVAAYKARSIGETRTGDAAQAQMDLDGLRKLPKMPIKI